MIHCTLLHDTWTLTFAVQLLTIRVGSQVLGRVDQLVQLRLLLLQLAQDVLQKKKQKNADINDSPQR